MNIIKRIHNIQQHIHQAERCFHRRQGEVTLLAVTKGHSPSDIEEAFAAGLREFGENYLQEALKKIEALSFLPLTWHFIGPIQSNKTRDIAHNFTWVHSVSRCKIAQLLNDERRDFMPPLNICLQVNFDDETTKTGVNPENIIELASYVLQLPRLRLCGLMLLPKQQTNKAQQYLSFLRLSDLLHRLNQQLAISMDTLSMGMSHDFEAAIRAGSTMVRIGTAIFGKRENRTHE